MDTRVIILPFDGMPSAQAVVESCSNFFQNSVVSDFIAAVKLNDALHFPKVGPDILAMLQEVLPPGIKNFPDLKIADVDDTDKNTLGRYVPYKPGIVTVTSSVSLKALVSIRKTLPETKIAIVDTLTDISEDECRSRYHGQSPFEKINHALNKFEELMGDDNPIQVVICSARETSELKKRHPQYSYGNPGIRSPHMAKDHQERVTSVYQALFNGAEYVVLGRQLTKGNLNHPDGPVSAEESQKITRDEIERFFAERI
jgi:orotidine-5'-phosphate decarboxylase